jgi:hypothetical protein
MTSRPLAAISCSSVSLCVAGDPFTVTGGKVYLTGPYNGGSYGLAVVVPAVAGPYDFGTVVLRQSLRISPRTAQVSVDPSASEPIPQIIQGIVTHVRDIRVYVDRPNFTLNATSCEPLAISSTLTSNLGQSRTVSSRFQAANCANLKFTPSIAVKTAAHPSKVDGASLHFKIAYPKGAMGSQSWMKEMKFTIPKQLPARLTTIQKACLASVFETNRAGCPAGSKIGTAVVHTPVLPVPLEGPVYFVSYGGAAFPNLVMVLQGDGVTVELHGNTLIEKGVTSATFNSLPDVPFENIEVNLPEGPYSALAANGNLCGQKLTMPTELKAQNGAEIKQNTPVTVTGCAKKHKAKHHKAKKKHNKAKKHSKVKSHK